MDHCREFVCADCKAQVFSFGAGQEEHGDRCGVCFMIRSMKLPEWKEKAIRFMLDVEIPEADDALRAEDTGSG